MAKGKKTGGRRKGTRNKASRAREAEVAASGLTPLDFLLTVLRNPRKPYEVRIDAAKAAAPYIHPKLASVQVTTPPGQPFEVKHHGLAEPELIGAYFARLKRSAAGGGAPGADTGADPGVGEGGQGADRSRSGPKADQG